MRKAALILLICVTSLVAMADGWQYEGNTGWLPSHKVYFDDSKETMLVISVAVRDNNVVVFLCLYGEVIDLDFNKRQKYVIFDDEKWDIIELEGKGRVFCAFYESAKMVEMLYEKESFTINVPVKGYGIQTFVFDTHGYPLN